MRSFFSTIPLQKLAYYSRKKGFDIDKRITNLLPLLKMTQQSKVENEKLKVNSWRKYPVKHIAEE